MVIIIVLDGVNEMNANTCGDLKLEIDFSLLRAYFNVSPAGLEQPSMTLPARELLKADALNVVFEQSGTVLRATSKELPASVLGLSLYGLAASQLIVLAQYSMWVDLTVDNLEFQLQPHETYVTPGYRIRRLKFDSVPDGNFREAFLEEAWRNFFTLTVVPLVGRIAAFAGVKPQLIWNQFAGRQSQLRDYIHENEEREEILGNFEREDTLLSGLAPEWFGLRRNPFVHKPKYIENPYQEGKKMMIRSSCCLYDKRENGKKCYNCPRLTEQERLEQWNQMKTGSS
ncbi:(2Fe-2S)-binding protein [Paenibacillus sp. HB172176]|uniref:(2Fe-2S)-binding protein n=1 Tax=Paenibacillus sp. HB172176 TaxID=2493690 RepID=UPI00143B04AA|nr:(2Fe-2S)-binding protein [Paenibacillus sp. HB172176]